MEPLTLRCSIKQAQCTFFFKQIYSVQFLEGCGAVKRCVYSTDAFRNTCGYLEEDAKSNSASYLDVSSLEMVVDGNSQGVLANFPWKNREIEQPSCLHVQHVAHGLRFDLDGRNSMALRTHHPYFLHD